MQQNRVFGSLFRIAYFHFIAAKTLIFSIAFVLLHVQPTLVAAQATGGSYRYIDTAGNIHFADSIDDIPFKYRSQFIPSTPTPYYPKGYRAPPNRQVAQKKKTPKLQAKKKTPPKKPTPKPQPFVERGAS